MRLYASAGVLLVLLVAGCSAPAAIPVQERAQRFIDDYTARYVDLYREASEAEWAANTRIVEGDTATAARLRAANERMAAYTGSAGVIETARALLAEPAALTRLQRLQLEKILYRAADNPQTVPDLVRDRIALEASLNDKLYGFEFEIDGRPVTPNEIDRILNESTDLSERRAAWEASKEVGRVLKDDVARVRDLRNRTVQALGYPDFFAYQASDYGMTAGEMMDLTARINRELYPLYRELHTWARYELAARYGVADVPDLLPAHWLPNRWGQDWSGLVTVEGADLSAALAARTAEDVVRQAEHFYVSLGFEPLPPSFYEKSSLYPVPAGAGYKKNTHASAWHMDLDRDVRSLMSVEPTDDWYETTHHELGHVYYYLSYTRPEVPPLLRRGANRAFHEAVGSLIGLASMQRPFLVATGMLEGGGEADEVQALLKEALNYIVFIPWSAGVMTAFEESLYADSLPADRFNERWWSLKEQYQGIAPPAPRGEAYADAATKTHVVDDPAQYYDYALSYLILFQLHDHIAREILGQDPRSTNYYGSREVGDFLRGLLAAGATADWRALLRETTGSDLSAQPMLNYFAPLTAYLQAANAGRVHTLPPPP